MPGARFIARYGSLYAKRKVFFVLVLVLEKAFIHSGKPYI